jgi:hypothetical protein
MTRSSIAGTADGLRRFIPLAVALSLFLVACVPVPGSQTLEPATPTRGLPPPQSMETPNPAAAAAQAALAAKLGVPEGQITVVAVERVEWPDACLGAAGEEEMCAQVITPGYRIMLEVNGKQVEVHTDESGQTVRIVTP